MLVTNPFLIRRLKINQAQRSYEFIFEKGAVTNTNVSNTSKTDKEMWVEKTKHRPWPDFQPGHFLPSSAIEK
jgi:hypothetical protein